MQGTPAIRSFWQVGGLAIVGGGLRQAAWSLEESILHSGDSGKGKILFDEGVGEKLTPAASAVCWFPSNTSYHCPTNTF